MQRGKNDCHQWLSHSIRVHHIRFWAGLRPELRWGAYNAPSDNWFNGLTSKEKGRRIEMEERGRGGRRVGTVL